MHVSWPPARCCGWSGALCNARCNALCNALWHALCNALYNALCNQVAPYKAVILPLDGRVAADSVYAEQCRGFREALAEAGLQYKIDESGASIGRRYAHATA